MTRPLINMSGTLTPTPHDLRLRLLEMGYSKLTVVEGKRPRGDEWQKHLTTPDRLELLERLFHGASSTGLVCDDVIGIDVDILHKAAADAVDQAIRDWFPNKRLLARYGQAPKRLFLFRAAQPIDGYKTKFYAPESAGLEIRDGRRKKGPGIEILGQGNQFVAFGIHEDTKQPYLWPDGSPLDVRRDELPELTEADAHALTRYLTELLHEQFGYTVASGKVEEVQMDFSQAAGGANAPSPQEDRPSQEERFKQTEVGGTFGLNQAILELPMKRHDDGVACEKVITELWEMSQRAFDLLPDDHVDKLKWKWHDQRKQIEDSVYGDINNRAHKHARLSACLSDALREQWDEIEKNGGTPLLYRKRGLGRGEYAVKDKGPAPEIPTVDPPPKDPPPKSENKYPRLEFITASALSSIPPREFYLGKQYQRGAVSGTMAPGGRGKSSLVLVEAVAMAIGRALLGDEPLRRLKVWYHNGEENWDELCRRLDAVCQHYSVPHAELEGWLCVTNPQKFPLRVAEVGSGDRFTADRNLLAHMYEEIKNNGFEVTSLDPLITLHGVPENNPVMMRGVMDIFRDMAASINCSTEVVGHTRKPPIGFDAQLTAYDTRGSGAIVDALRSVRMLDLMTVEEANKAEVEDYERERHVKVTPAKRNYSATAAPPQWIKIENLIINNGDDVGVVTPWEWPGQDPAAFEAAVQRSETLLLEIMPQMQQRGQRLSDKRGINFAPKLVAETPEAKERRVNETFLTEAMKRLIASGRIQIRDDRKGHEILVAEDARENSNP